MKGELRFSLAVPNPFGEGESFHHFHLRCAALRQPEAYLEVVGALDQGGAASPNGEPDAHEPIEAGAPASQPGAASLPADWAAHLREHAAAAQTSVEHRRLRRFVRAELASSGRAQCRQCREPIAKGELRLALEIFDDGRANPAGFVHVSCARAYAGTSAHVLELISAQTVPGSVELEQVAGLLEPDPSGAPHSS